VWRLGGLCAPDVYMKPTEPGNLTSSMLHPHWIAKGLQRDRNLQRLTFRYKRGLPRECIDISHDEAEDRLRPRMARPLMDVEGQNRWMQLWLMPLTRRCVSLALLAAAASPAAVIAQGTLEQRLACTPDVLRLCSAFIPNADEITICLREKNAELSDACRTVFEAGMNAQPSAGDSNQAHRRITK
jgi:hypothetical protein